MRVPHFSRPLREVGTTTLGILIFQLGASERGGKTVRVGRTLLADALDVAVKLLLVLASAVASVGRVELETMFTKLLLMSSSDEEYPHRIGAHHSVDNEPGNLVSRSMESWWRRRFNTKPRRLRTAYGRYSYSSSIAIDS
jgi:hypothetical protein